MEVSRNCSDAVTITGMITLNNGASLHLNGVNINNTSGTTIFTVDTNSYLHLKNCTIDTTTYQIFNCSGGSKTVLYGVTLNTTKNKVATLTDICTSMYMYNCTNNTGKNVFVNNCTQLYLYNSDTVTYTNYTNNMVFVNGVQKFPVDLSTI